jgi:hypothetical protein
MTQLFVFGRPEPKPRQVAVVGSRDYRRLDLVRDFVLRLPDGSTVVSGGARGVDQTAVNVAKARGLQTMVFQADWQRHGRAAGPMRNAEIVAHAKEVIAFWDCNSRGTLDTIVLAHRTGLGVAILDGQGDLFPVETALRAADQLGITTAIERVQPTGKASPALGAIPEPDLKAMERELDRQRREREGGDRQD